MAKTFKSEPFEGRWAEVDELADGRGKVSIFDSEGKLVNEYTYDTFDLAMKQVAKVQVV